MICDKMRSASISADIYNACHEITDISILAYGSWTNDAQIAHVHSEISEVWDVMHNKDNKYGKVGTQKYEDNLRDELSDVFLAWLTLVQMLHIPREQLNEAIKQKIGLLETRIADGY